MRLKYEILWFEDNDSWFNTSNDILDEYLEENGFQLIAHRHVNANEGIETILMERNFDLILMDYNLEGQHGDALIKNIRDLKYYTDIVFYSQNGAQYIRELIKEKGIDGVFCSGRQMEEFEPKVNNIIKNTIKKVQDVNNMRGLVIAETIDLEYKIANILKDYFKVIEEEDISKAKILKGICDKKQEQVLSESAAIQTIHEKQIDELIDENILTTYNLYTGIQSILKSKIKKLNILLNTKIEEEVKTHLVHEKQFLESIKDKISNFEADIIFTRNTLAHVKEILDPKTGISYLQSLNKSGANLIFDDNKYIEIRKKLLEYSTSLNDLSDFFSTAEKIEEYSN